MTYRGHIHNGQIALDEPAQLPEGAIVRVEVINRRTDEQRRSSGAKSKLRPFEPIEMPGGPLSDDIIRDRR